MSDVVLRELHTLLRTVPEPVDELRLVLYRHLGDLAGALCIRTKRDLGFVLRLPGGRLERAPEKPEVFADLEAARRELVQLGVADYRAAKQRWWRECRREVTRQLPEASGWALACVRDEVQAQLASRHEILDQQAVTVLA